MSYSKEDFCLAAKACGYEIKPSDLGYGYLWANNKCWKALAGWNPAESDADAFRAADDAGIDLIRWHDNEGVETFHTPTNLHRALGNEQYSDHPDKHAATRKAIMDCLIAIGKERKHDS